MNYWQKSMFHLFETICIRKAMPHNLSYHQDRVTRTFQELFPYAKAIPDLAQLIKVPDVPDDAIFKCRFLYNESDWSVEFAEFTPRMVTSLKTVSVDNLNYKHKYLNRRKIDELFTHRGKCDDVLIVRNGYITDSSIANIVFKHEEQWYTPAEPLLPGTCRARLLARGIIRERKISQDDLSQFSHWMLINAMNDFDLTRAYPVDKISF
jgi:4-amino-4-deoxychorismate lyase